MEAPRRASTAVDGQFSQRFLWDVCVVRLVARLDRNASHRTFLTWDIIPALPIPEITMPHRAAHHGPRQQPAHVTYFIQSHAAEAQEVSARSGIPVEVILAQSALESDWGRKVNDNAYFGIKGRSTTGASTVFTTHEVDLAGRRVAQQARFRAYANYSEAADDYAALIQRRFPTALAHRDDPTAFAQSVADGHYATDPQYGQKLKSIIRGHVIPSLAPQPIRTQP
jgi:flagellar protein FlgJ